MQKTAAVRHSFRAIDEKPVGDKKDPPPGRRLTELNTRTYL